MESGKLQKWAVHEVNIYNKPSNQQLSNQASPISFNITLHYIYMTYIYLLTLNHFNYLIVTFLWKVKENFSGVTVAHFFVLAIRNCSKVSTSWLPFININVQWFIIQIADCREFGWTDLWSSYSTLLCTNVFFSQTLSSGTRCRLSGKN